MFTSAKQLKNVPPTAKEAMAQGLSQFNTGKPCCHGHTSNRYTRGGGCVECKAEAHIAKHGPRDTDGPRWFVPRPVQIIGNPDRVVQRQVNNHF